MRNQGAWSENARRELLRSRTASRGLGWSYRPGRSPAVEPSAWAAIALLTSENPSDESLEAARETALGLAAIQNPDGSTGVSPELAEPGWTTPLAILCWRACGGFAEERRAASRYLLSLRGQTMEKSADRLGIVGHDTTLRGWPWVFGTHSWVEPTANAILALRAQGIVSHPRVREGLALLENRAIDTGGWNYGNSKVFSRSLRPQPAPTAAALLALRGFDSASASAKSGLEYLAGQLGRVRSPISLAWTVLALRAWGACPADSSKALEHAYLEPATSEASPLRTALLLLADSPKALQALGLECLDSVSGEGRAS